MEKKLTPRKQQALEMRRKIQTAALDLFDREGFENVSVESIAQASGCSVGNIYHYFKSKDELALQVTDNVDEVYRDLEQLYDDDTTRPAIDKLMDTIVGDVELGSGVTVKHGFTGVHAVAAS